MEALIEYTHALGRAHTGDLDGARKAIARMQQLREATKEAKFDYFKRHLELQTQAASAWIAYAEGKKDEAIEILRRSADSEDTLGKHPVSPGALVPIREQLGDLLLEQGRPAEAAEAFQAALKIYPGRFRGLYGAALAAERTGDKERARQCYVKLAAQTAKSDAAREELKRIRQYRTAAAETASSDQIAIDR
jgi:tetratricopeptide (TPR) repeat protein